MNIEKKPAQSAFKPSRNLFKTICSLRKDQAVRITTAREARAMAGMSTQIARATGKRVRTKVDGDDILVWLEEREDS